MTRTYKVDVINLKVSKRRGDTSGSYSFNYRVVIDNKETYKGLIDSTFTVSLARMKRSFRSGYAFSLVMHECLA